MSSPPNLPPSHGVDKTLETPKFGTTPRLFDSTPKYDSTPKFGSTTPMKSNLGPIPYRNPQDHARAQRKF
ncbi:hypothetical protein P167DRAFT_190526 [Morchella conica CCBAS932]|uniref:Uncharacterized protein n=1 Tax=Morchella conica CCBAS932 TaxID=1392247 RepID=A0A3N4L4M9_9PEZI|nr:hypothetical protein P167DRAFT_190526 [Morchella conica CCBAS932]